MIAILLSDFGNFSLSYNGSNILISRRKSQALLLLLARSETQEETRSALAAKLWSNGEECAARTSLRQELLKIKNATKMCDIPIISTPAHAVSLGDFKPELTSSNIVDDLKNGTVPDILLKTASPQNLLLSSIYGLDAELDIWIANERRIFENNCQRLLHSLIAKGDTHHAAIVENAARAMLNFDPTSNFAALIVMKNLVHSGFHKAALEFYDSFRALLREDYNIAPSEALNDFYKSMGRSLNNDSNKPIPEAPNKEAKNPHPSNQKRLILGHLIEDIPDAFTANNIEALRLELLGTLARFRDWSVRQYFKQGDHNLPDNWYEIKFHLVDKSKADRLIVTVEAMPHSEVLLNETIAMEDYHSSDALKLFIQKLAVSISNEITAQTIENALRRPENDRDLLEQWLIAQQSLISWRADDEATAEKSFRTILSKWPNFHPAMTSLVEILNTRHHIFPGLLPDNKRIEEALNIATKAVRVSPHYVRAHNALGWSRLMAGNHDQAATSFDKTIQLNHSDASALISAAMGLCFANQKQKALETAHRAIDIAAGGEPIHWAYHAFIRYMAGRFEEANFAAKLARGSAHYIDGLCAAIAAASGDIAAANGHKKSFTDHIEKNWYSSKPLTNDNIRHWLVSSFPIRSDEDKARFIDDLKLAGLS